MARMIVSLFEVPRLEPPAPTICSIKKARTKLVGRAQLHACQVYCARRGLIDFPAAGEGGCVARAENHHGFAFN